MCTVCEDESHESGKGQKSKGKEEKGLGERKRYRRSVRISESKQTASPCSTRNASFPGSSGHYKGESRRMKRRQAEHDLAGNALVTASENGTCCVCSAKGRWSEGECAHLTPVYIALAVF